MRDPSLQAAALLCCALLDCGVAHADEAERGRAVFGACRACHALDPAAAAMAGPNLAGIVGRRIGGDPAFDYSPVLRKAHADGWAWTPESLDAFLADPEGFFPGMWMTVRPLVNPGDRMALVRFLADPNSR